MVSTAASEADVRGGGRARPRWRGPQTQTGQRVTEQASLCCDPGSGRLGPCPQTSTMCVQPGRLQGQALPEALGCGPSPGAGGTQAVVTLRAAEWPGHPVQTSALPNPGKCFVSLGLGASPVTWRPAPLEGLLPRMLNSFVSGSEGALGDVGHCHWSCRAQTLTSPRKPLLSCLFPRLPTGP